MKRRRHVLTLTFVLAFLLVPGRAGASSAAVVGEELLIGAEPGEVNRLFVELVDRWLWISDSAGVEAGAGCSEQGKRIRCRARGVVLVVVHTGDLNDTVRIGGVRAFIDTGPGDDTVITSSRATVVGGPGNDHLRSGASNDVFRGGPGNDVLDDFGGRDVLKGGAGNDRIYAQDQERDRVFGGRGHDEVGIDCNDRVANVEEGSTICP